MTFRRTLILAGVLLIFFLGMYSWNRSTHVLDDLAIDIGLELGGTALLPFHYIQKTLSTTWKNYFDLLNVRRENEQLKERILILESFLAVNAENRAELYRLRQLLKLPPDVRWHPIGARVLSGRIGPNAILETITINRGYATGAQPGVPLVTHLGLVGRVLKSSAHASTVLLLSDPGCRIAVICQRSRAMGILMGRGPGHALEVDFVKRDMEVSEGDILVTSGLDAVYPKGIPVARVISVAPSDFTEFMAIKAMPLADLRHLEEVLLLNPTGVTVEEDEFVGPPPVFVGPPKPGTAKAP